MQSLTEKVWLSAPPMGLFDETLVGNLFPTRSVGARKLLLHRAIARGEIDRLKPGLYCLSERWRAKTVHPFALASVLLTPSHISVESALRYHGLIPEAVREVASVTTLRSRSFNTSLGNFTYRTVPSRHPRAGVRAVSLSGDLWAFVATPLRAIADLVYLRRGVDYQERGLSFLTDSLRLELDELCPIERRDIEELTSSVGNRRTVVYLEGIFKELGR